MIGYDEFFTFDINPERMSADKAIEINAKVLRIMNERINALPHDKLMDCFYHPEANRGRVEDILADSFAIGKR
jgi:xylose isomerase